MKGPSKTSPPPDQTAVLGFRLPRSIIRAVKIEAAKRDLHLNALFEEMWAAYERRRGTKNDEK